MSLKDLANNLRTEDEVHTFVKSERGIRRTLSLQHTHQEMSDIIRSHKYEEERKSNVQAYMTNYFLHHSYKCVSAVCDSAIDIIQSLQVKTKKEHSINFSLLIVGVQYITKVILPNPTPTALHCGRGFII